MKTLKTWVIKNLDKPRVFLFGFIAVVFVAAGLLACQNLTPEAEKLSATSNVCTGTDAPLSSDGYTIRFEMVDNIVDKNPVRCGSNFKLSSATMVQPQDLEFFVSSFVGVKADGSECNIPIHADGKYQYTNMLLLDFAEAITTPASNGCSGDAATNFGLKEVRIPIGLKKIKFTLGLQPEQNNLDAISLLANVSPVDRNSMYWGWTDGYKFTKIEFRTIDGTDKLTEFHLGSVGCTTFKHSSPETTGVPTCPRPFRVAVELDAPNSSFEPDKHIVYLKMENLFDQYVPANVPSGGCMPGEAKAVCRKILDNLGLDKYGKMTGTQKAFVISEKNN